MWLGIVGRMLGEERYRVCATTEQRLATGPRTSLSVMQQRLPRGILDRQHCARNSLLPKRDQPEGRRLNGAG